MNVTNTEWRVIEDRLQRLSDLLFWQWEMRLDAWKLDNVCLVETAEKCEARTTAYIRYLREVLTVPYAIENRSTVVCERLGIRCIPHRRSRGLRSQSSGTPVVPRQSCPVRPAVAPRRYYPHRPKGFPGNNIGFNVPRKSTPAPAVQTAPAVSSQGTGRGRGMWGRSGPLPTARPPHASYLELFHEGTMIMRNIGSVPIHEKPATRQHAARGGRFFY